MDHEIKLQEMQKEWHGTYSSYAIGFTASILLTIISFSLIALKALSHQFLFYAIVGLALVQAIFQFRFFLHVGQEPKPRWETLLFSFMILVVFIVVGGSLWIMADLDARMMGDMIHD